VLSRLHYTYSRAEKYVQDRAKDAVLASRLRDTPTEPGLLGKVSNWAKTNIANLLGDVLGETKAKRLDVEQEVTTYLDDHTTGFLYDTPHQNMEDAQSLLQHYADEAVPVVSVLEHLRSSVKRLLRIPEKERLYDNGKKFSAHLAEISKEAVIPTEICLQEKNFPERFSGTAHLRAEMYGDVVPEAPKLKDMTHVHQRLIQAKALLDRVGEGDPMLTNFRSQVLEHVAVIIAQIEYLLTKQMSGWPTLRPSLGVRLHEEQEHCYHTFLMVLADFSRHLYPKEHAQYSMVRKNTMQKLQTNAEQSIDQADRSSFVRRLTALSLWKTKYHHLFVDHTTHDAVSLAQTSPGVRPIFLELLWSKLASERTYCVDATRRWILEYMRHFSPTELEAICELDAELRKSNTPGILTGRLIEDNHERTRILETAYQESTKKTGLLKLAHETFGHAHLGDLRQMLANHTQQYMPYIRSTISHALNNGGMNTLEKNPQYLEVVGIVDEFHDKHADFLTLEFEDYSPLQQMIRYQQNIQQERKKLHQLLRSIGPVVSKSCWVYALESMTNDTRWLFHKAPSPQHDLDGTILDMTQTIRANMLSMQQSMMEMKSILRQKKEELHGQKDTFLPSMQLRTWHVGEPYLDMHDPTIMPHVDSVMHQWFQHLKKYAYFLAHVPAEEARVRAGMNVHFNRDKLLRAIGHIHKKYDFREVLNALLSQMLVHQREPVVLHALLDLYLYLVEIDTEAFSCSQVVLRDYITALRHSPIYGGLMDRFYVLQAKATTQSAASAS